MDDVEDDEEDAAETPDEDEGSKKRKVRSMLCCIFDIMLISDNYLPSVPLAKPRPQNQPPRRPKLLVLALLKRVNPQLTMTRRTSKFNYWLYNL